MPRKFVCALSTDELKKAYLDEHRTLAQMAEIMGCRNSLTVAKVLHERGISTNNNARLKEKSMHGMSDDEFKAFLIKEYESGKSMAEIGVSIGITPSGVRKYFVKYGINRRGNADFFRFDPTKAPNWKGGRRIANNGYIEVFCPDHPNANVRRCVYEHQIVMEQHIGRYIRKGEVVHHIDGNKTNNDISNLLLLSNADHAKLHGIINRGRKRMKEGD